MTKFRPLGDRVLVLPDAAPEKKTGLAVPTSQRDKATEGTVVAVGFLASCRTGIDKEGKLHRLDKGGNGVMVGDRVQFAQYGGRKAMHNGVEHKLLRLEEIEGVIEDDNEGS